MDSDIQEFNMERVVAVIKSTVSGKYLGVCKRYADWVTFDKCRVFRNPGDAQRSITHRRMKNAEIKCYYLKEREDT